jgi:pantoate--beta-alanine ligase
MPTHPLPKVISSVAEARAWTRQAQRAGKTVGVVPTMGALHAGHLSLVEAAKAECDLACVTIFVNPTQFAPGEDFEKYPRDLQADLELLATAGADQVFAPNVKEMYPPGHATYVEVEGVSRPLEGAHRPTHFRGVATIVLKLFQALPADRAYFGQKDFQQTLVIKRMVADLDVPVEIRICPIVREADGLAMSSRNRYLSADDRRRALALSQSLALAEKLVAGGERNAATILAALREKFAEVQIPLDYLVLTDPNTLADKQVVDGPTLLAIAARVGSTRLIDNVVING